MSSTGPWYANGYRLEGRFDSWRRALKARLGWLDPAAIQPFRGYGDSARVRLKGRVLEMGGLERWRGRAGIGANLMRMFHRFESDEIPDALVRARFRGRTLEARSGEEGYFEIAFDDLAMAPQDEPWRMVELELVEPLRPDQAPVRLAAPVLVPPPTAALGVISDIDDTIVRTGATNLLRNLRTTLFTSVDGRVPFKGIAAFYQALQRGAGEAPVNPIFYVSSSPWNLYDLLEEFMRLNEIPAGPLFLRDLGWDQGKLIKGSHEEHKLGAIETLLDFYPGLRFILVGDSGQHDAAIYREVVRRHPERILAVYIRELGAGGSAEEDLGAVRAAGVEAVLCPDLLHAAQNAARHGWIADDAVEAVQAEIEQQKRAA